VVERRARLGFALEAHQALEVVGEVLRQHLERDLAAQARVPRAPHLSHRAPAVRSEELAMRE